MTKVQTPQGVGILVEYVPGGGYARRAIGVAVIGLPVIPYDEATMPIVSTRPASPDVDAWMAAHSTPATRKANDRRVAKFRRAATTPSKLRADKLIGKRVGSDAIVSARMTGGYVIENHAAGCIETWRVADVKRWVAERERWENAHAELTRSAS